MEIRLEKRKKHEKKSEKRKNIEQARVKIKQLKEEIVVCKQCKQEAIADNDGTEYIAYFSQHIKEKQHEIKGLKDSIIGYSPVKHNAFAVSVLAFIGIMLLFFLSMASTNNITGRSVGQMNYTVNNSSNTDDMNLLNATSNTSDFAINRNLQLIAENIMPLNYTGVVVSSDNFVLDDKKEVSLYGYKYSNTSNFILSSTERNSCSWYPDDHPKKDLKTCEVIIEVINKNPVKLANLIGSILTFSKQQKTTNYTISTEYSNYKDEFKINDIDVFDNSGKSNKINITRKKWANFSKIKPIENVNTDFSIRAVFDMPKYETEQFNISLDVKYQGKSIQLNLDPDVGSCGTLSSAGTYTLNSSINTTGTCFTLTANHIILDGGGYAITGDANITTSPSYGITTAGYINTTIKNFGGINNFTYGVYINGTNSSTVFNNTIIGANLTGASASGIFLDTKASFNNLSNNNITVYGRSNGFGIILSASANTD
ncbi:hypothetical protein HYU06_01250, partial [Candidatus Woesearchaeota archaeon]|nr:hypothetical protein [Candidatus Woesearchaeota archaeon]